MKNFFLLFFLALTVTACSSVDSRTPASVEQKEQSTHQKFQGYFDKPDQ